MVLPTFKRRAHPETSDEFGINQILLRHVQDGVSPTQSWLFPSAAEIQLGRHFLRQMRRDASHDGPPERITLRVVLHFEYGRAVEMPNPLGHHGDRPSMTRNGFVDVSKKAVHLKFALG